MQIGRSSPRNKYAPEFNTPLSERYSKELSQFVPGGVNSPFRSFREVGGHTIFFAKAKGSRVFDIDGNNYIDYLGAWGPAILGHSHPDIIEACRIALDNGPVFGAPHELELDMARAVIKAVPSMDKVRFVSSGTEAVMSAVRLARGYTQKNIVVMFEGGYHGHSDSVLASTTHQSSAGIPQSTAENTVLAQFNSLESLERALQENSGEVAAVLIEPVPGSMGVIAPEPGFLAGVRKLCDEHEVVLIFDEVITGFRLAYGGAQQLFNVRPDLTCFGKALGGGMPIGAFGGRASIMDKLMPDGDVYQAGTFSGNPVTMAGGIELLRLLSEPDVYPTLDERADQLVDGITAAAKKLSLHVQVPRVGSMFAVLFAEKPVRNYADSLNIDAEAYATFFHYLLQHGVYMPPSGVDAACVSYAHTPDDVETTIRVCERALQALASTK